MIIKNDGQLSKIKCKSFKTETIFKYTNNASAGVNHVLEGEIIESAKFSNEKEKLWLEGTKTHCGWRGDFAREDP